MTTETIVQQVAALCRLLAEMEKDCPTCGGCGAVVPLDGEADRSVPVGEESCPTCDGSGRVARFPGVRVPCPTQ